MVTEVGGDAEELSNCAWLTGDEGFSLIESLPLPASAG